MYHGSKAFFHSEINWDDQNFQFNNVTDINSLGDALGLKLLKACFTGCV